MVKKLVKTGNSLALVLDKPMLEAMGIDADTPLEVSTDGGILVVSPVRDEKREARIKKYVEEAHREISRHSSFLLILGSIQRDGPVIQVIAERLKPILPKAALTFKSRNFR